jgi:hypothetical protein
MKISFDTGLSAGSRKLWSHGDAGRTMSGRLTTTMLAFGLAVLVMLAQPLAAGQQDDRKNAGQRERHIPIMTWPGPDASLLNLETFRLVAEAGFSVNMSFLGGREANLKALDLARAAGLRLMVQDDRISQLVDSTLPLHVLTLVVADYKDHPAFYGYCITDEPNASRFERLGLIVRRLRELDPAHPAYINLFPTYANEQQLGTPTYEDHVARYLATVRPPFLSFDHYPVTRSGLRPDYYRNLEIVRRMAMERGLDLWAFTLVTPHAVYPPPTLGHIRLQLWSDIAYGAKALQYFTFVTPGGTDFDWGGGLVDKQGRPGPAYPLAREANAEVRRVEGLILRWKSVGVSQSEPLPEGTRPLAGDGPVVSATGAPLVVGFFSDGAARYVLFVNRDYENPRTAIVRFSPDTKEACEVSKDARAPARFAWPSKQNERVCALDFEPGAARIFRVRSDKN